MRGVGYANGGVRFRGRLSKGESEFCLFFGKFIPTVGLQLWGRGGPGGASEDPMPSEDGLVASRA